MKYRNLPVTFETHSRMKRMAKQKGMTLYRLTEMLLSRHLAPIKNFVHNVVPVKNAVIVKEEDCHE